MKDLMITDEEHPCMCQLAKSKRTADAGRLTQLAEFFPRLQPSSAKFPTIMASLC